MNIQRLVAPTLIAAATFLWSACTSTQESTTQQTAPPPAVQEAAKAKVDTVHMMEQSMQKPAYEAKTSPSGMPAGRYSVQVGAYKMPDNAERISELAKERFGKNVYTVHDAATDLYKVLVGDFMSKDDARNFRDDMVRQFPSDYRDAWVFENPQK